MHSFGGTGESKLTASSNSDVPAGMRMLLCTVDESKSPATLTPMETDPYQLIHYFLAGLTARSKWWLIKEKADSDAMSWRNPPPEMNGDWKSLPAYMIGRYLVARQETFRLLGESSFRHHEAVRVKGEVDRELSRMLPGFLPNR